MCCFGHDARYLALYVVAGRYFVHRSAGPAFVGENRHDLERPESVILRDLRVFR
jgi:hypothetical protein